MANDTGDDDDDMDLEEFYNEVLGEFGPMLGSAFTASVDDPEEVEIAVRLLKASHALQQFVEYAEEHDLDPTEVQPRDFEQLDYEEQIVLVAFSSMARAMIRFGNTFDDDDDDNPFKVSDGDDPIY